MLVNPEPPPTLLIAMAHPDDLEYSAAGTVARWTRSGTRVVLCVCTNGERGSADPAADLGGVARVRVAEQRAAAGLLGCAEVNFLGYPDGELTASRELRRDLVRLIRRVRPDAVMCPDPTWRFDFSYVNHPDHAAAGEAALRAVDPDARNWHAFPELARDGLAPHEVRRVFLASPLRENCLVDIGPVVSTKIAALSEHASQVSPAAAADVVHSSAADLGKPHGLARAEAFYLITLG